MAGYRIEHDRPNCIGCAACATVCPEFWSMGDDGKSVVKGGKKRSDGWEEREINDGDYECNKSAADSCPVNVIHLFKKDTGEKII
ncbi:MAG: ferredoxin [Candidatus Micrarchaeia archaeon]